jgi:hypothetical protein
MEFSLVYSNEVDCSVFRVDASDILPDSGALQPDYEETSVTPWPSSFSYG